MIEWIAVPTLESVGEYPDFCVYGFYTGKLVLVRRRDGTEQVTFYNGYGMFGQDNFMDVTHWRPVEQCKKCGADMKDGIALEQTYTGSPDFIGGEVCTVSAGGTGKLVECKKCPECGWSVTN